MNNGNINRYVTKAPLAQFAYNLEYECEQARKHAGIPPDEWRNIPNCIIWMTEDDSYCKADYIALYRLSTRLETVANDIQAREVDKQARQAKMRRGK